MTWKGRHQITIIGDGDAFKNALHFVIISRYLPALLSIGEDAFSDCTSHASVLNTGYHQDN